MSRLAILSIAVLGKQGNPLFLESYASRRGGLADLKWHYAAHTALDFFEERGMSQSAILLCSKLTGRGPALSPHLLPDDRVARV